MKKLLILSLLIGLLQNLSAQKTLTGVWSGSISNDSTTVRKDQDYEIALTEYKGKVYGYARSSFIVNDTLFTIMKRVQGSITGDSCEITDDEILSYNFRGKLDKGVKMTSVFKMNQQDSTWHLAGRWQTNKTKKYYSVSGKMALKEESSHEAAKILDHLKELGQTKNLEFVNKPVKENKPEQKNNQQQKAVWAVKKEEPKDKSQEPTKVEAKSETAVLPKKDLKNTVSSSAEEKNIAGLNVTPVTRQNALLEHLRDRQTIIKDEAVLIVQDSVVIALYDNGEIDGDSVSVILNDEVIIANQCLKTTAIKKTIYLNSTQDNKLVLFAENLGSYPPNTGLLVIYDGDIRHQVRFSADLQKNAGIILRKKK